MLTGQPGQAHIAPKEGAVVLEPPVVVLGVVRNAVAGRDALVVGPAGYLLLCQSVHSRCFLFETCYP